MEEAPITYGVNCGMIAFCVMCVIVSVIAAVMAWDRSAAARKALRTAREIEAEIDNRLAEHQVVRDDA